MSHYPGPIETAIEELAYIEPGPHERMARSRHVSTAVADVVRERVRQETKGLIRRGEGVDWRSCADPAMSGGDGTRFLVLGEEVGEVANAVLERGYGSEEGTAHLREELVQVAAVAVAWIEAIDAHAELVERHSAVLAAALADMRPAS